MARALRIELPGGLYHIMSRGNAKAPIFIDDRDRIKFIDILAKTVLDHRWVCHAYCLMGNHYHLLVETPDANLSDGMHLLNGMYTQAFNHRHLRTGHVYEGRFRSNLVEKGSYLLELSRYIVLNPVRAGLTARPEEYRWSSYHATCGTVHRPGFLHTDWILEQFGNARTPAVNAYVRFVNDALSSAGLTDENLQPIIGSESFVEKMTSHLQEYSPEKDRAHPTKASGKIELKELFGMEQLNKRERNWRVYKAFAEYRYTRAEIAEATGLHFSSIARIIAQANANFERPDPRVI
ncbi:MAG: addiction module toxin RelE [Chlorobiaceae bacterium]|nr:addiction module toxin RelE [Chlorobiaceae bacterium]NTW74795.1 addiction module toxin RelE [Chlorobiaceae bacterium]